MLLTAYMQLKWKFCCDETKNENQDKTKNETKINYVRTFSTLNVKYTLYDEKSIGNISEKYNFIILAYVCRPFKKWGCGCVLE